MGAAVQHRRVDKANVRDIEQLVADALADDLISEHEEEALAYRDATRLSVSNRQKPSIFYVPKVPVIAAVISAAQEA